MFPFLFFLFLLGTLFGSFSTVLIERWHSWKSWIIAGRSECPKCLHILGALELIPLLSYIFQKGRCKNCKKHIPLFYPAAEVLMGIIFLLMGMVFWNGTSEFFSPVMFLLLILGFITGIYILYDIRFMEIPDQILIPGIFGYLFLMIASLHFPNFETWFYDRNDFTSVFWLIKDHLFAAVVLYSFFYLQILIPGSFFLFKKRKWKDLWVLIISYITFPFELLWSIFTKKKERKDEIEIPAWIGGGDLRVALFMWLTLGFIHGIIAFFLAYILGSIIGIFLLLQKWKKNSQIAFWPFLWVAWLLVMVFHNQILNYIFIH